MTREDQEIEWALAKAEDSAGVSCAAADGSALAEHALAEARLRIIARYEHVETWLKQPATATTLANWAGIVEGLRQARRIIGAMWDELPVPKPQAVIDHDAQMSRVIEEQNDEMRDRHLEQTQPEKKTSK